MNGQQSFCAINERNILGHVGDFGEELAAAILGGEITSHSGEYPYPDIQNYETSTEMQVKMCNARHQIRILPQQIESLYEDTVENPFVFTNGIYVLVFYSGIVTCKKRKGKSLILSRKFGKSDRQEIIAKELRYIYIVDVQLLMHTVRHNPELIRGRTIVESEGKENRDKVLYLNRTFLAGFLTKQKYQSEILRSAYGQEYSCVNSWMVQIDFNKENSLFERNLPVHFIGSRSLFPVINSTLTSKHRPVMINGSKVILPLI